MRNIRQLEKRRKMNMGKRDTHYQNDEKVGKRRTIGKGGNQGEEKRRQQGKNKGGHKENKGEKR